MAGFPEFSLSRRRLLRHAAALGGGTLAASILPAWARSGIAADVSGERPVAGRTFDLNVAKQRVQVGGRSGNAILVNGQLPAPLLRWREGDEVTLRVTNRLKVDTSIHWHGILLPYEMDGVPGISFPGIRPGETFTYRFPLLQAGTYWYHSHSGLQEQLGHYGPIVIEPREPDSVHFDREHVIVLSDWTFEDPHRVFGKLKKMSDNYNFQQRTVGEFFRDLGKQGRAAWEDRVMWGDMRMNPTDISDVTGATYTYLLNGQAANAPWRGLFAEGERVRLRVINASAMSIFNLRIPGLPMTVIEADGLPVAPVETDEFQIGVAETFDVIVEPQAGRAYAVMAETIDRSGFAVGMLAPRPDMQADVPPMRKRPTLTMKDMAMDHSAMGHAAMGHEGMDHGSMDHSSMDHSAMGHEEMDHAAMGHEGMDHGSMDHSAMGHDRMDHGGGAASPEAPQRHDHPKGPGVVGLAANPVNRLGEPPLGLEQEPHRVLVYTDLRARERNPDTRPPEREIELHLTSNMERYMWSFDGRTFSEVREPIRFRRGERLRLVMVNDTMMVHPIHLHGMFFEVVTGEHDFKPRKHTIAVKPGEKMAVDITADAPGEWAFHCHLLYHMHAGMMRVVSVQDELA